jgi:glycosyltransferase involved in cell wall biosynthesis
VWPETFSYTLSAAIASGIPVVATRIGAFTERLEGRPYTWLADHRTSPADWIALFNRIRTELFAGTAKSAAVPRSLVPDFYAEDYLGKAPDIRPAPVTRTRAKKVRPVIAIVPERFDTGAPTPCAYIRLLQPLYNPAVTDGFDVVLADTKTIMDYHQVDIIVTQRFAVPDIKTADTLARHARRTKATLLYDLDDDLLRIAPEHPEASELRPLAKTVRRMLGHADAVWVSTAILADRIRAARQDTLVMPNAIDDRLWSAPAFYDPRPHQPARILCMGTTTHDSDFAMIAPTLARIKQEFRQSVEIDIIGMTRGELPSGLNRIGIPNGAVQSYPGFVNWLTSQLPGWHIGLAPLIETPFNLCKSSIKTMDYAAMGMAVLASDMPVYRGSVADGAAGFLVANDCAAWYAALNWLVRDEDLRRSIAAGARPAFVAKATLASQSQCRRAALLGLLRTVKTAA